MNFIVGEKIVTQHGGHIGVYSGEGSGSTFYVELKAKFNYKEDRKVLRSRNVTFDHSLMILDDKIDLPLRQTPARFSLYPDKRYRHALVADDSDLNRKMMCNVLGKYFQDIVQVYHAFISITFTDSCFRLQMDNKQSI